MRSGIDNLRGAVCEGSFIVISCVALGKASRRERAAFRSVSSVAESEYRLG